MRSLLLALAFQSAPPTEPSPADQLAALVKQYRDGAGGGAANDDERRNGIGRSFRRHEEIAAQLVALAERCRGDSIALDALVQAAWQVNTTPWPLEVVGPETAATRALVLLQRDHLASPKLAGVCERLSWGLRAEYEPFFRAVAAGSSDRTTRGVATFSLAHYLGVRRQRFVAATESPEQFDLLAALFGRDYVSSCSEAKAAAATRDEADALLARCEKEFADVALPSGAIVGARATAERFELAHLSVGCVAPEVEGVDHEGRPFKLSERRGKVVLLDFWHQM